MIKDLVKFASKDKPHIFRNFFKLKINESLLQRITASQSVVHSLSFTTPPLNNCYLFVALLNLK